MNWYLMDRGKTIGQVGSEDGLIIRDDEHSGGARITLERDSVHAPFAITCGIYGWMFHTRRLGKEEEALHEFDAMKIALARILEVIPYNDDPEHDEKMEIASRVIHNFVEQYP
jgi:hypothetical protein